MTATEKLTAENVAEFWTHAWANGETGWRAAELMAPFTRNLYAALVGAGVESGSVPFTLTDAERNAPAYLSGPAELAAVRKFLCGRTVLVPLCGDSAVLPYLLHSVRAKHVIGVDLSAEAMRRQRDVNFAGLRFSACAGSAQMCEALGDGGGRVTLVEGDVTKLRDDAAFNALRADFVYDRAALMAVAPTQRADYIAAVAAALAPHAVVALEKMVRTVPAERNLGPPFMVDAEEAQRLFKNAAGRTYKSVRVLVDDHPGPRHAEWYVLLPEKDSANAGTQT